MGASFRLMNLAASAAQSRCDRVSRGQLKLKLKRFILVSNLVQFLPEVFRVNRTPGFSLISFSLWGLDGVKIDGETTGGVTIPDRNCAEFSCVEGFIGVFCQDLA